MSRTVYIALLRAVNVGGRVAKMERVRAIFSELGLDNVRSYIQSGNVFFETDRKDHSALTEEIEQHLKAKLGFEVPVFLRTADEVARALALDPFKGIEVTPDTRLSVVFFSEPLPDSPALPHRSPKGDFTVLSATPGEAFVVMQILNGRSGNPAAFVEKAFRVTATARFFNTTGKILAACRAA